MKNVKIHYTQRDNIGDAINPYIVERVLGCRPIHSDIYHCQISGIGSGLGRFLYDPNQYRLRGRMKRVALRYLHQEPLVLWSSGFIKTPTGKEQRLKSHIIPSAVRGSLSLQFVKTILKNECEQCVTGDAGILASQLLDKPISKRYRLGIIPHDNERGNTLFEQLRDSQKNATIIDVRGDVIERLKQIAECEYILSSSLHGLIIADSFHIPNRQIIATNKLAGDGFKFADYYSVYDTTPDPLDLRTDTFSNVNDIIDHYTVPAEVVEEKKKLLYTAFHRYL